MITVFMDGGSKKWNALAREHVLSWGVVAHFNDETTELCGSKIGVPKPLSDYHEMIAFVEAMRYAQTKVRDFSQMSFYTDDMQVAYAGFVLHPANFAPAAVDKLKERLQNLCHHFYDTQTFNDAVSCLTHARFCKVKGHDMTVYNQRVDYLARYARNVAFGKDIEILDFEKWMKCCFMSTNYPPERNCFDAYALVHDETSLMLD